MGARQWPKVMGSIDFWILGFCPSETGSLGGFGAELERVPTSALNLALTVLITDHRDNGRSRDTHKETMHNYNRRWQQMTRT